MAEGRSLDPQVECEVVISLGGQHSNGEGFDRLTILEFSLWVARHPELRPRSRKKGEVLSQDLKAGAVAERLFFEARIAQAGGHRQMRRRDHSNLQSERPNDMQR